MNIEKPSRQEILSQNIKDLQRQVTRTKQTIAKDFDKDMSLARRIVTLFPEHGITIIPILTTLSMNISTTVLAITGVFRGGGGGGPATSPPKDKRALKK